MLNKFVGMRSRLFGPQLLGIIAALTVLSMVVAFMSVPFLVGREPTPAGDYPLGDLVASPDIKVFPNGTFLLTVNVRDIEGKLTDAGAISASMQMAGMDPNLLELSRVSTGLYRGAGLFPMPGRWVFTLRTADGSVDIPVGSSGSF